MPTLTTWRSKGVREVNNIPSPSYLGTGAFLFNNLNSFFHSSPDDFFNCKGFTQRSNSDKQFIKLHMEFNKQFDSLREFLTDISPKRAEQAMASSLSALLDIEPEKISLQLLEDKSIFYTLTKDGCTIFFQHYLAIEEGGDECIITIFYTNGESQSFAGNLSNCISQLIRILPGEFTAKIQSPVHEFSF